MVPQSMALVPAFAQTLDGGFVCATHIVLLAHRPELEPPCFVATTDNNMTFRLSPHIAEQLLRGAARELPGVPTGVAS